jgi:ankyrin repeat protein
MESNISFACYNYKIENVKILLNINNNYFILDHYGWTPLHRACSKGYESNILRNEDTNKNDDEDGIGASECTRAIEYDC